MESSMRTPEVIFILIVWILAAMFCSMPSCMYSKDNQCMTFELCNGRDDDCDGAVDEDFEKLGRSCDIGQGACFSQGIYACDPTGFGTKCNAIPKEPAGFDVCNGIDDDCDGVVDYYHEGPLLLSSCDCTSITIEPTQIYKREGQRLCDPQSIDCSGPTTDGYTMAYCWNECDPDDFPWAQCSWMDVDLNRFDIDHAGRGALEIGFCNDTKLYGALNIYYGEYPRRKQLRLLNSEQIQNGLAPGCHRVLLGPGDAVCPIFDPAKKPDGLPDECLTGCESGSWKKVSEKCMFAYDRVPVWLSGEECVEGKPVAVSITKIEITYHRPSCVCIRDSDCLDPEKPYCEKGSPIRDWRCQDDANPRCAGVCASQYKE